MVPNRGNNFRINLAAFPPNWRPTENFHALFIPCYFDFRLIRIICNWERAMLFIVFIFLFSFIFARPGLITSMAEFGVEMERNLIQIYRAKPVCINYYLPRFSWCFPGGESRNIENFIRWIALHWKFRLLRRQSWWNGDYGGINKLRGAFP